MAVLSAQGGYSGILVTGMAKTFFGFEILGLGLFLGLKFTGGLFLPLRFWQGLFWGLLKIVHFVILITKC